MIYYYYYYYFVHYKCFSSFLRDEMESCVFSDTFAVEFGVKVLCHHALILFALYLDDKPYAYLAPNFEIIYHFA